MALRLDAGAADFEARFAALLGRKRETAADVDGQVADIIADVRPDTVLTFGPDGMTGHLDHRSVSSWATAAVRQSEPTIAPLLLYATKTGSWCDRFDDLHRAFQIFPPDLPPRAFPGDVAVDVELRDDLLDRKVAALLAHASQVAPLADMMGEEAFRSWVANECFRPAAGVLRELAVDPAKELLGHLVHPARQAKDARPGLGVGDARE